MRRQQRCFTLLEVMVVLALISLVAGVVGVNAARALRQQRFYGEVSAVVSFLQMAQQLMAVLNTDIDVKFEALPEGKGIRYWLEFDEKLAGRWNKEIARPRPPLQEIHYVDFKEASGRPSPTGKLLLRFLSGGDVMSQGILRLSTAPAAGTPGNLDRYICLPGFPHFLRAQPTADETACDFSSQRTYNEQISRYTSDEVREKMRQWIDEKKS